MLPHAARSENGPTMRYVDTSQDDLERSALSAWMRSALTSRVIELRIQSGYFDARALGVLAPTLQRLADEDQPVHVLIGSNDGETLADDVALLATHLGLPRSKARLAVVAYCDAKFHPKTVHVCHDDGRQAAYVGSANITQPGLSGSNVEAGITLDTAEGDAPEVLKEIARSTEAWFEVSPEGLFEVIAPDDVQSLREKGILATERPSPGPGGGGEEARRTAFPKRGRRLALPPPDSPVPEVESAVLVAELAGPGRWSQAAFPRWLIDNFFQVQPDSGEELRLWPVSASGKAGPRESRHCGHKGSGNWYYELSLANKTYPDSSERPIGVFLRLGYQEFRYTILMPDDADYGTVAALLTGAKKIPKGHLRRATVSAGELRKAWPDSPLFPE